MIRYDDFTAMVAQLAHALRSLGLTAGDRMALYVDKSPQALALSFAAVQTGVIFIPLNNAYSVTELTYFIQDSGAALVVCDDQNAAALHPIAQRQGAGVETLNADGSGTLMKKAASLPRTFPTAPRSKNDLAAFLYTSGTTGRSKGAMLSQENLLSNAQTLVEAWRFEPKDVLLHALPIFHTHGLFVATNVVLAAGASMIFHPKFSVEATLCDLPRASTMMGVPTFYTRLLSDPRFDAALCAQMRLFISGSAPLLAQTHLEFEERTGHRILERYGMTETNMNTSNPYDGPRRAGSVGTPLRGVEVIITDGKMGRPLPQGQTGHIEVRGPNVFHGYWNMPEKTAQELRENGFFITGDLGYLDAEGYLYIIGRNKDLIISGGYNIYPKEIEDVLDAQLGVLESAIIGVPDPDMGEAAVALIVLDGSATLNENALQSALETHLAPYKRPKKLLQIAALPRNTMGKVQKNTLREDYKDIFITTDNG